MHRLFSASMLAGLTAVGAGLLLDGHPNAQSPGPCDPPNSNAIVCENALPGNLPSEWDINGAGDQSIQGFTTDISVDQGQTVTFKIDTNASAYHLDIYRMGYYGGLGARKVATVLPSATLPQIQPDCLTDAASGLIDCGNWGVSASWTVPATATSGIYFAKVIRNDNGGASHVMFIVRDDDSHADVLFQTSDTTWQAYNQYGGHSLYVGGPGQSPGRAYKVSYNRPFTTRLDAPEDWVFNAEYPMVRWLESNGYNVSYTTGMDSDRRGAELLEHKLYLSNGHDEYWSAAQRTNVEAARDAGVHLAFFSGNEVFWKTRWENSVSSPSTAYRTLVSYKETHSGAKIDPVANVWTGTWGDPRLSPPADGGRPQNALTGQYFRVNCCTTTIEVPSADGKMRFWRGTAVANLAPGAVATLTTDSLGYEWDQDEDNGFRPAGLFRMSTTISTQGQYLQDWGSTYGSGTANHALTMYRAPSGALVFGAGTVQWSWGLDSNHDRGSAATNLSMKQATINLFADMGVQPLTVQAGLTTASPSSDTLAPVATIVSPTDGATVPQNTTVTISGTATDLGGGQVAGVEVSVDGGTTWHPATGRAAWTYSWATGGARTTTVRARAVDDSGNLQNPGASASVTVGTGQVTCPCSIWSAAQAPTNPAEPDNSAVELGVKFRSTSAGYISAIRFYKGATNTGNHIGNLWSASGALLGTAVFTGESASGWQQVSLPTPVAIAANTTYIASYHTDAGNYADDQAYFTSPYANGPLEALQDGGTAGRNGVFKAGATGFPTDDFNASNYWVDIVFINTIGPDTTPPTVTNISPSNGASSQPFDVSVTGSFSEDVNPSTVSGATFELRDSSNVLVPATVSYNSTLRTATLDPTPLLAVSTVYTAKLRGGSTGIKDTAGNALTTDVTWSFTTSGPPPPPPTEGPGGPILVVTSTTNPFSTYYAEILRAEGLNAFTVMDRAAVTSTVLNSYDVVILGEMTLTTTQVTMFSDWVTAGGNLIAMRPDKKLASLLGLTDAASTLADGYLLVNTSTAPGAGIVGQTMQFHGTADSYTLSGASSIATLFSASTVATANPAVTIRSVGSAGGQAAAFSYDLAKSIIYTRQGNPAWSGQERDGSIPRRSDDLFFGGAQPNYVDLAKVAIPQADEQQRLLANMISFVNADKKPLPKFWYFPRGLKAVVVMTGDDHASAGTVTRFNQYLSMSAPGCSVVDWECIRGTSYLYPSTPMDDAQVAAYTSQGFEIALHLRASGANTDPLGCNDYTMASLTSDFTTQLGQFATAFPSSGAVQTNRNHCIVWSDYDSGGQVELAKGIRLDTNYYYWPGWWINDVPGMFTGSGMPMRFAKADGTMIDIYQATTQMTDESDQTFPYNVDTLLDRAIGAEGYYGAFVANMHTDFAQTSVDFSNAIIASATARGIPVITAKQLLTWVDGRNASSFANMSWNGNTLGFNIVVGGGANGIQAMLPAMVNGKSLASLTRNGSPVPYTVETIKGVWYAFFSATPGSYAAAYAVDTTPPVISNLTATPANISANITWTTNEIATARVDYGRTPTTLFSTAAVSNLSTAHLMQLSALAAGTTYYYRVTSVDASGNLATSPVAPATGSFTTGTPPTLNCPCSIWPNTATPAVPSENDDSQVELGLKFKATTDGYVTGIRFYKGSLNDGAHRGNLWTANGALLGTVTFSNETASGWQTATLGSPVAVSANTTYVVSYHTTSGFYSDNTSYFNSAVTNGPLQALASGASGGNGVYKYGTGGFPTESFSAANYWVDLVFVTSLPPDNTPPTVTTVRPFPNLTHIPLSTPVTATFSEPMNVYSITSSSFELRNAANALVSATLSYDPSTRTATLQPTSPLAALATYTARVLGGAAGVKDFAGNPLAADRTWSFTTSAPPPPPPTAAPGGPILVVTTASNPFTSYYAEILRAEGLNAFALMDLSAVTSTVLNNYDVVILGEMPLSTTQVTMFSNWVTAGGNLIAMRPDKKLASLLGLTDASATLADAYMQVATAAAPGTGIVSDTMQFHGTADRYTLTGATNVATLFSTAATSTANPAVTVRSVGVSGGQAAAFTYDLARSVVYTRQGNPAWAGQERDASFPIRSDDLFFGGAQPNYVDMTKVAIPQADEQQRLLSNLIEFLNLDRKPLPKFWYFPRGLKAVVVMTGDDHANNGTAGRFDIYNANSAPGCSVQDWECVRASSYVWPETPIPAEQAAAFVAQGFEIGVHIRATGPATDPFVCNNYTAASFDTDYTNQTAAFTGFFPNLPPPATNRTHCIVWSDYDSQPQVEYAHGVRLDTTYYYYPASWVNNVPGMFTGSGMPMRFAKLDGTMIDVYQAATQMTDESNQGYPYTAINLLDRAIGPEGYYGAFVANMHTDRAVHEGSVAIVASAQARGIPIIAANQLLEWADGRNNSAFGNIAWSAGSLSFTVTLANGSRGIQGMLPTSAASGTLTGITQNGLPLAYTVQTIKGISYAMFPAAAGTYIAEYGVDTIPPAISGISATQTWNTATIVWTTNEAATTRVDYGVSPAALNQTATGAGSSTAHSINLSGLTPQTPYYYRVVSADPSGNTSSAPASPGTFTTAAPPPTTVTDTTAADFGAGTVASGVYISQVADGEVGLAPALGEEFSGTTLPAAWSMVPWNTGGTGIVSGGALTVDGARVSLNNVVPVGQRLEFGATFPVGPFVHVGFGLTLNESPWMIFSSNGGDGLYARTNDGTTSTDTPLPGSWLGTPHRFRIDWTPTSVQYYIDGNLVATHAKAIGTSLRPLISELNPGGVTVRIDWMRLSPFATAATFTSRVLDGLTNTSWLSAAWNASLPAGTGLAISARFGNTPVPDASWTSFAPIAGSGAALSQTSRYVQYQAAMTGDGTDTPALQDITFSAAPAPPPTLSVAAASVSEGNAGTTPATFVVTLSAVSVNTVTVDYATGGGTATAGTDYASESGTLTFAPGVTSLPIPVSVIGDTVPEANETFQLTLSNASNATIATAQATGTIVNDDVAPSLSINSVSVAEGNSGTVNATFAVTLSAASSQTVTVNYATANGTATAGSDYTAASGTLTFAPGTTTQPIAVPVTGDLLNEPNETFTVTLSAPANATIAAATGTGTITNDDLTPSISINSVSVTEGNTGSVNAVFTATLSAASAQSITVNYATANGTATAGSDYTAGSGQLTFAPGITSQTITVPVLGDVLDEANETFTVTLSGPVNATLGTAAGTGTITDNDAAPTLAINSVGVTEGTGANVNATFTVTLSAVSGQNVTVNYATANGTATSGSDYTATSGTLTFAPGTTTQTVTVPVLGDTTDEPNETFTVGLSAATNATIATATGTGTITDNDAAPTVSINSVSATEGNTGSLNAAFTATLSAASGFTVTAHYQTANGTAVSGSDYTAVSGTVTFTPGTTSQTINVPVLGDTIDEPNETFTLTLSAPANATLGTATGTGTIVDNDAAPTLAINNVTVTEGNGGSVTATFTVTLTGATAQAVTVNYATANGTATSGADYTATSGTLSFPVGTTTRTIAVAVLGDVLDEANETYSVVLSAPTNATIATGTGTGTITDNDATPSLAINNVTVTEGNVNAGLTVTLSAASGHTVTVNYATANGTAVQPGDYTAKSGTLTFAPGVTTQPITVAVNEDTLDENNETIAVNLSGAVNATIADSQGIVTITDDDPAPSMAINNVTITEGNSGTKNATFTVTLSAASGLAVAVNYATLNVTATAGSDYNATSATLNFAPGTTTQTFNVVVRGDTTRESNEIYGVTLSAASNATIADNLGLGTITNDNF